MYLHGLCSWSMSRPQGLCQVCRLPWGPPNLWTVAFPEIQGQGAAQHHLDFVYSSGISLADVYSAWLEPSYCPVLCLNRDRNITLIHLESQSVVAQKIILAAFDWSVPKTCQGLVLLSNRNRLNIIFLEGWSKCGTNILTNIRLFHWSACEWSACWWTVDLNLFRGAMGATVGACQKENGRCCGIVSVIGIRVLQFSLFPPCRSATLAFLWWFYIVHSFLQPFEDLNLGRKYKDQDQHIGKCPHVLKKKQPKQHTHTLKSTLLCVKH